MHSWPTDKYRVIAADPPWTFNTRSQKGLGRSPQRHYECMSLADICALPVADLADRDCHLFLWTTGPMLAAGQPHEVARAWGFKPTAIAFVWIKQKKRYADQGILIGNVDTQLIAMGPGHTTRQNAEFVLLGRRGNPKRLRRDIHQIIIAPRREHSRKPDEFYRRVEAYAEGPRLDLFSRQRRPDWDAWGNQVDMFGDAA